jgi:hypothetical protein
MRGLGLTLFSLNLLALILLMLGLFEGSLGGSGLSGDFLFYICNEAGVASR